jgi:anti-sigma B factor antagonist
MMDAPLTIDIVAAKDGTATIVRLVGPVVIAHLFPLQTALRKQTASLVVLDMVSVPYIDSSGLGAVLNCYVSLEKNGRKLALAGVNERVRALLELTRVEDILSLYPDVESALGS